MLKNMIQTFWTTFLMRVAPFIGSRCGFSSAIYCTIYLHKERRLRVIFISQNGQRAVFFTNRVAKKQTSQKIMVGMDKKSIMTISNFVTILFLFKDHIEVYVEYIKPKYNVQRTSAYLYIRDYIHGIGTMYLCVLHAYSSCRRVGWLHIKSAI